TVKPDLGTIVQGVFSGDVSDVRSALKKLSDDEERAREAAIKAAGVKLDGSAWAFPDWKPGADYVTRTGCSWPAGLRRRQRPGAWGGSWPAAVGSRGRSGTTSSIGGPGSGAGGRERWPPAAGGASPVRPASAVSLTTPGFPLDFLACFCSSRSA